MGCAQAPPYCIVASVRWGSVRTLRIPEEWIPRVREMGWSVLICDSDMPPAPMPMNMHLLSGQNRRHWLNETDAERLDDNGADEPDGD